MSVVAPLLRLLRSSLGADFVALLRREENAAAVLDNTRSDAVNGMLVDLPERDVVEPGALLDTHATRISSAWVEACGFRPVSMLFSPVTNLEWTLLVAWSRKQTQLKQSILDDALDCLHAAHGQGLLAASERSEANRLEALMRELDVPLVFVSTVDGAALVNDGGRTLLNLPGSEVSGHQIAEALQSLFREEQEAKSAIDQLSSDPARTLVFKFQKNNRLWSVNTRRTQSPEIRGRIWAFDDITDITTREKLYYHSLHEQTLARISVGVAHNFNNILTVIMGALEISLDDVSISSMSRRMLHQALLASESGAAIVAQLLSYAGVDHFDVQVFSPGEELKQLRPFLKQLLPDGVKLDVVNTARDVVISGSSKLFRDSMINAVLNARDSMVEGGCISISLTRDVSGSMFQIMVEDTGAGMSRAVLERAFEPFFTTRSLAVSKGLGLSVIDGFAKGCDGEAWLESTEGRGTRLFVKVPLSSQQD